MLVRHIVDFVWSDSGRRQDKEKLTALRNIRAAFLVAMKEDGSETLPDDKAQAILRKVLLIMHKG